MMDVIYAVATVWLLIGFIILAYLHGTGKPDRWIKNLIVVFLWPVLLIALHFEVL